MKILNPQIDLDDFFDGLECSDQRLLMLDYDGTLSPYQIERHEAVPYPGIRKILSLALALTDCRTVIISGRAISDLLPLLGIDGGIEIWGCHGWERLSAEGDYTKPDLDPASASALDEAAAWASAEGLEKRLEIKTACVAIHWRGLDPGTASRIETSVGNRWNELAGNGKLKLHGFSGGIELRPVGMNKGIVAEKLMSESTGPAAYLGDDSTDEDAFKILSGRGLGILVSPELRDTAADLWLIPPNELIWFLERWIESCGKNE
jgi:trehalose-phosphatase